MKVIIIQQSDSHKFPLLNKAKDSEWMYLDNSVSGDLWLTLNAEDDIKGASINYVIGKIEIVEKIAEMP